MSNNIFPGVANAIPGFLSFICLGCCFFPSLLIRNLRYKLFYRHFMPAELPTLALLKKEPK